MRKKSAEIFDLLSRELDPAFSRRAQYILENIKLTPKMHVLDIGCGRGFYEGALAKIYPDTNIIGLDTNSNYLKQAQKNTKDIKSARLSFKKGDINRLPFEDNYFDRVVCSEVLEHIPNDQKGAAEIYRVAKKGGKALITVPVKNYPFLWDPINFFLEHLFGIHLPANIWWISGIWAGHERLYKVDQVVDLLKGAGFKIEKVYPSTGYCMPFAHFLLYGTGKNLVEKGLVRGDFDRFSFDSKPSALLMTVKNIINLFDKPNEQAKSLKRFVNVIVIAQKMKFKV